MKNYTLMCFIIILIMGFFLSGCTIRHGDFTVASNKVMRLSDFDLDKAERTKGVEGEDIKHIIFGFPTGVPTIDAAVDDALEKGNGDVMTDAVLEYTYWTMILYGQVGFNIKGDVVKTRKN